MKQKKTVQISITLIIGIMMLAGIFLAINPTQASPAAPSAINTATFTYHSVSNNYYSCMAISTIDFDQNGYLDILSADHNTNGTIHQWVNVGGGSFSQSAIERGQGGATGFLTDDFDYDGDIDFAVVTAGNGRFGTFQNLFANTDLISWTVESRINSNAYPATSIAKKGINYGDANSYYIPFTSDGTIPATSGVVVHPYVGYPKLGDMIALIDNPSAVHLDDINRDGYLDFVSASKSSGNIRWHDEHNLASYNIEQATYTSFSRPIWLETADMDNDGDADVVAASDTKGLFWWENADGKGTTWQKYAIVTNEFYHASSLNLADMDNDGDTDIIAATNSELLWWENLGSPTAEFNWIRHWVDSNGSDFPQGYAIVPADMDGDGQMDLVGCDKYEANNSNQTSNRLGWWENKREPVPASAISHIGQDIDTNLTGAWGIDLADFNGDGRLDVAAAGTGTASITGETRWWQQNPSTGNWTRSFYAAFNDGRGVTAFASERARPSYLVTGDSGTGEVREFFGNDWAWVGTGQTSQMTNLGTAYETAVADYNNDTQLDLFTASASLNGIYLKSPGGSQTKIGDCLGARAVCTGDFNGDGYLDVAAACPGESEPHWFHYSPYDGTWSKIGTGIHFVGVTDVACGDIDNDSIDEFAIAIPNNVSVQLAWLGYDPTSGSTEYTWVTNVFTGATHIDLADMDEDGNLDIIATSENRGQAAWFENQGTHNFPMQGLDEGINGPLTITAGDISGDGALDVALAASAAKTVRWYEQEIPVELSLEKNLDIGQTTDVVTAGQSIPYIIEVTNSSLNGSPADILIVDTWEPAEAIIEASGEGCVSNVAQGIITCTMQIEAGHIAQQNVSLVTRLSYDGQITNSAKIVTPAPFTNLTPYDAEDQAVPVTVLPNPDQYDLIMNLEGFPNNPITPASSFQFQAVIANQGPNSPADGSMGIFVLPSSAVSNMGASGAQNKIAEITAVTAEHECTVNADDGAIICDFSNLTTEDPLIIDVSITTSEAFTDILEFTGFVSGVYEGYYANDMPIPVRIGSRPLNKVYLPLVIK